MHIAFVTYEYPPDTSDGGIATYTQQAVRMLRARGHSVEVFAASRERTGTFPDGDIPVHRVLAPGQKGEFGELIAPVFARRHAVESFDVVEGPDFNADAREVIRSVPDIPLVVRLHTPRYLATALNTLTLEHRPLEEETPPGWPERLRPLPGYDFRQDFEYHHLRQADAVTAPSRAIRDLVCRDWRLDPAQVEVIPNVYQPAPALLELPLTTDTGIVAFVGRLEGRKGVLALAKAIPLVLQSCPDVRFRLVGRPVASPDLALNMRQYLEHLLAPYAASVSFEGPVRLEEIPGVLRDAAVCVFPSLWENFPCVCLEAMAAGRGIVGSLAGGMAEMLQEETGLLAAPDRPEQIAAGILHLHRHPELRQEMGRRARERVLALYRPARIAAQQEESYRRAIQYRQRVGTRVN
jgi:glycogen(starch) synthase